MLWKIEHLLQKSKCSIFHTIFKNMVFQRRQKALLGGIGLKRITVDVNFATVSVSNLVVELMKII